MALGDGVGAGGFSHAAMVYDRDQQLLDAAVPFLREGVAGGDTTVLSVGSREQPLILDALGDRTGVTVVPPWPPGAAFRTLRQNHQLVSGEADRDDGQVRIFGAVPSTDEAVPWGGWVRYETAINHVYSGLAVSMLCPYDRRVAPAWVLDDVKHTHPFLLDSDGIVSNSLYVEPTAFLDDLAERDLDPIESEAPTLELIDQLPGASRRSVAVLAEDTELDRATVDALILAVGEVATNAVVHGKPPVVLRAWALPDRVVVTVLDHGAGPTDPFVGMLPLDTAPSGGLGLHVVYQTCSLVTMSRTSSQFTVHLTMRQSPPDRHAELPAAASHVSLQPVRGTAAAVIPPPLGGRREERKMSGDADKAKGHIKQAVGELTDDDELEREGKIDEMAGRAKNVADKAKDAVDDVKDKLTGDD